MPCCRAAVLPMGTHMRARGFAFIEVVLGLVVVAILASIVIMVATKPNHASAVTACQKEAKAVDQAVRVYHARHDNVGWPSSAHHKMSEVAESLLAFSNLDPSYGFRYLDGSQRQPPTQVHGWTYDFKNHTVNEFGCLSAN
jgi:prepilin-type N-terminal cleavage/methylation domain-containing protein